MHQLLEMAGGQCPEDLNQEEEEADADVVCVENLVKISEPPRGEWGGGYEEGIQEKGVSIYVKEKGFICLVT